MQYFWNSMYFTMINTFIRHTSRWCYSHFTDEYTVTERLIDLTKLHRKHVTTEIRTQEYRTSVVQIISLSNYKQICSSVSFYSRIMYLQQNTYSRMQIFMMTTQRANIISIINPRFYPSMPEINLSCQFVCTSICFRLGKLDNKDIIVIYYFVMKVQVCSQIQNQRFK